MRGRSMGKAAMRICAEVRDHAHAFTVYCAWLYAMSRRCVSSAAFLSTKVTLCSWPAVAWRCCPPSYPSCCEQDPR